MGTTLNMIADEPAPEINTTPLVDVMLVLLIMFIITIPVQTHSVPLDLPKSAPLPVDVRQDRNQLAITADGTLLWNGVATTLGALPAYLDAANRLQSAPELQLLPHAEARYERVDQVLAIVRRSNVRAMGILGNERYASF